jgi:NADPH-dependent 2,4-dienoyl-CoA reductase/sulfur reductase-like enzyme
MGRALFADPYLPKKAQEGDLDGINMCIACMRCTERTGLGLRPKCTVNYRLGKEKEYVIHPVKEPKKVLILGGGPAGMEAARVATLRGHEVSLYEKNRLGGQLNLAAVPPYKGEIKNFTEYLINQVKKLEIDVHLNHEASTQTIAKMKPDFVIVATGAEPLIPSIPGTSLEHVTTAWSVLKGEAEVGEDIIIAGGGMVGCETGEYLADQGKNVKIVEMLSDIGADMEAKTKWLLKSRFTKLPIQIFTNTKIERITQDGVLVYSPKSGKHLIKGDTVVLALGSVSNRETAKKIRDEFKKLHFHMIGDCVKPRKTLEAIHEGFRIAYQI